MKNLWLFGVGAAALGVALCWAPTASAQLPVTDGLQFWLDAGDIDGDGNPDGLADDSPITMWADKAGGDHGVMQFTQDLIPILKNDFINGLPVVQFDGADDYLSGTAVLAEGDDTYTYYAVWQTHTTGLQVVMEQASDETGRRAAMLALGGSYGYNGQGNDQHGLSPATPDEFRVSGLMLDGDSSPNVVLYNNGGDPLTGSVNIGTANVGVDTFDVARKWNNGEFLNGEIAELMIYDRVLSGEEVGSLNSFLGEKYAIPIAEPTPQAPAELLHQWTFNDATADDSIGTANGIMLNGASIAVQDGSGGLLLDGVNDMMLTQPLGDYKIGPKTLVSWVTLDNLDQSAGSALSVQSSDGNVFDGIVFAERVDDQWMAGSNGFVRTVADNLGPAETEVAPSEVMMAIVYGEDNGITIYRNGELYADPANASQGALQTYSGTGSNAIFGRRHGTTSVGPPQFLAGFINEARVYGYGLDATELAGLYAEGPVPGGEEPPQPPVDALVHQWTFNDGTAQDLVGSADVSLHNGATIVAEGTRGALKLDGTDDFAISEPTDWDISAKTLVSWVKLDHRDQGGGSALSLVTDNGDRFDGIIFAERVDDQWMAGSDFWRRSVGDNGGPVEADSPPDEVMMAIVYGEDSSITLYRNGEFYGDGTLGELQTYPAGFSTAIFGPRHGTVGGVTGALASEINEARIYNFAMDAGEIAAVYADGPVPIPEPSMLALLACGAAGLLFRRRRQARR